MSTRLRQWLHERSDGPLLAVWMVAAAFSTYFCMYAFRKPLSAGTYEGLAIGGVDYKTAILISQIVGYTLSKFLGIKVIAELTPRRRVRLLLMLIGTAWIALLAFALIPHPFNFVCVFFNGLPLGMVWGIVFSFLEGRRRTELMGAGLCASFVVASGAVKWVGRELVIAGVPEFWMPATTGLLFALPLLIFSSMLAVIPPPGDEDLDARTERVPMDGAARRRFFLRFAPGIVLLTLIYALLNAYRDFRDNFAPEIWASLGHADEPAILAAAEVPIAVTVLFVMALMIFVRDNAIAFFLNFFILLVGGLLVLFTTRGFESGAVDATVWMIAVGGGMYLAYIAFHVLLWERLIALFKIAGNIGFLMYVCDAFGYLGSVALMIYKDLGEHGLEFRPFFVQASYWMGGLCIGLGALACAWFALRLRSLRPREDSPEAAFRAPGRSRRGHRARREGRSPASRSGAPTTEPTARTRARG